MKTISFFLGWQMLEIYNVTLTGGTHVKPNYLGCLNLLLGFLVFIPHGVTGIQILWKP